MKMVYHNYYKVILKKSHDNHMTKYLPSSEQQEGSKAINLTSPLVRSRK